MIYTYNDNTSQVRINESSIIKTAIIYKHPTIPDKKQRVELRSFVQYIMKLVFAHGQMNIGINAHFK